MSGNTTITVKCFKRDSWLEIDALSLVDGDTFVHKDETYICTGSPYFSDGLLHVPSEIYDSGAILLASGEGRDYIYMAMDYTSSPAHDFGDGTMQICQLGDGKTHIYSPRLPITELNEFCKENINHYETFFSKYKSQLYQGDSIEMTRFW